MKALIVGVGFVGLGHAAVSAEFGHTVFAYDIDEIRIQEYNTGEKHRIEKYVNEPELASIVQENLNTKLFFITDISNIIEEVDIIFMCVNTPPNKDGSTNLTFYDSATKTLASLLAKRKSSKRVVIANKSTVPIGTAQRLERILSKPQVKNVGAVSNPEFLAQGKAIEGSRRPSRVVIGASTSEDFDILRSFYPQFVQHVRIRYIETTPTTAESIKYLSNTLLLTYISFWNGVGARLAETFDDIEMEILRIGVTADDRISNWGAYVGNGAGGSCFGKDIQSLIYQLNQRNQPTSLLQSVYDINEYQKSYLLDRVEDEAGFNFNKKTIAILGLSFKKQTNDMRDSASLRVVESLLSRGVSEVRAYDPLAMDNSREYWFNVDKNHLFERITYHASIADAILGSDAVYIATDWEEFRGASEVLEEVARTPYLIIDGRRMIHDFKELAKKGFSYLSAGGKIVKD